MFAIALKYHENYKPKAGLCQVKVSESAIKVRKVNLCWRPLQNGGKLIQNAKGLE